STVSIPGRGIPEECSVARDSKAWGRTAGRQRAGAAGVHARGGSHEEGRRSGSCPFLLERRGRTGPRAGKGRSRTVARARGEERGGDRRTGSRAFGSTRECRTGASAHLRDGDHRQDPGAGKERTRPQPE